MVHKTYFLPNGNYATSDEQVPVDFIKCWDITDEQYATIISGGGIFHEGDTLFVTTSPFVEPSVPAQVEESQE